MKSVEKEQGQTVVIVAFAVIALLAFAGLAIDGGTAYLNRRRMQNAADAGPGRHAPPGRDHLQPRRRQRCGYSSRGHRLRAAQRGG